MGRLLSWRLAVVVAVTAAAGAYASLADSDTDRAEPATAGEILASPEAFAGERVTVTGTIARLGPRHFTIGRPPLLVVATEIPEGAATDGLVRVVGTVRVFDLAEVEDELDAELDDERLGRYEGAPVIVAEEVDAEPRVEAEPQEQ